MLTLVTEGDRFTEAQMLFRAADAVRPSPFTVLLVLLPLLAVALLAAGHVWAWCLIGASVALALSRYGPRWWPGRR